MWYWEVKRLAQFIRACQHGGDMLSQLFSKTGKTLWGNLPLGKTGKIAKNIFYFLKADKKNSCKVFVTGKAVNKGDGKGMKIPCHLVSSAERKYIAIILAEKLCTLFLLRKDA